MENKADVLRINAAQREEIRATSADLFVSVKGSSLVSSETALQKAREVSSLVEALGAAGLPQEAIHLQSVQTENSSGALLRGSSATYRLRLRCDNLEQFPELLGVIASQKNSSFERVEWIYPDEEAREEALEKAIGKAGQKAARVAKALGVRLMGISFFAETFTDQEAPAPKLLPAPQGPSRSMGIVAQPDLGMNIQHSKMVEVRVDIEYRISSLEPAEPAVEAESDDPGEEVV